MDKVKLEVKNGEAVIKEGGNSFIGKLMASANKVRIHKPGVKREVKLVKEHRPIKIDQPTKTKKKEV